MFSNQQFTGQRITMILDDQVQVEWSLNVGIEMCFEQWRWIDRSCQVQTLSNALLARKRGKPPSGESKVDCDTLSWQPSPRIFAEVEWPQAWALN